MKFLVREKNADFIIDEFNSKEEAEKNIRIYQGIDRETGHKAEYEILLRAES